MLRFFFFGGLNGEILNCNTYQVQEFRGINSIRDFFPSIEKDE